MLSPAFYRDMCVWACTYGVVEGNSISIVGELLTKTYIYHLAAGRCHDETEGTFTRIFKRSMGKYSTGGGWKSSDFHSMV